MMPAARKIRRRLYNDPVSAVQIGELARDIAPISSCVSRWVPRHPHISIHSKFFDLRE